METIRIQRISFWSVLKLSSLMWLCFGAIMGIVSFVMSLISPDQVYIDFLNESFRITGITAGLLGIPLYPVLSAVMGFLIGIIIYLPFILLLKIVKGLRIKVG